MQLIKLTCHNCNSQLEIDLDHLQVYCPYCGTKLMIGFDQLGDVLAEREKTKRAIGIEEERTKRQQLKYENKTKESHTEWKKKVLTTISCLIIGYLVFFYMPNHLFDSDKKEHDELVARLQEIEAQIDTDIEAGNYDSAILKINKLYCDDHWSSEETEAWDKKRNTYLEIVESKKAEANASNPDIIFMPAASENYEGQNYSDIVEQFKQLGFTNITTQSSAVEKGFFDKKNTVEHILIGGKTSFKSGDYFNKDTSITIYFY